MGDKWVSLHEVFGVNRIPLESAVQMWNAMDKALKNGDINDWKSRWLLMEYLSADYNAGDATRLSSHSNP
jgi:hypothetical protein